MNTFVYYSTSTEGTHKFAEKMRDRGYEIIRIPKKKSQDIPMIDDKYILIVPTYKGGVSLVDDDLDTVPKKVIEFLETGNNKDYMMAVVSAGNTNFAEDYCLAGKQIEQRYLVPNIMNFELSGTDVDVLSLDRIVKALNRVSTINKYKKQHQK